MDNSKEKMAALAALQAINKVDGFDPVALAVEYTDLNNGEKRKRLPVMAQMGWFRLVHPMGKISVVPKPVNDYFEAHARVYANCHDAVDNFLGEGTAVRRYDPTKPNVSPREWAQTAAIGIALRNAGFGLSFDSAGDGFDHQAVDETASADLPSVYGNGEEKQDNQVSREVIEAPSAVAAVPEDQPAPAAQLPSAALAPSAEYVPPIPTPAPAVPVQPDTQHLPSSYEEAMKLPCPVKDYAGKTLGDVLLIDPDCISWIATKYKSDPKIAEGARLICEHALNQAS